MLIPIRVFLASFDFLDMAIIAPISKSRITTAATPFANSETDIDENIFTAPATIRSAPDISKIITPALAAFFPEYFDNAVKAPNAAKIKETTKSPLPNSDPDILEIVLIARSTKSKDIDINKIAAPALAAFSPANFEATIRPANTRNTGINLTRFLRILSTSSSVVFLRSLTNFCNAITAAIKAIAPPMLIPCAASIRTAIPAIAPPRAAKLLPILSKCILDSFFKAETKI